MRQPLLIIVRLSIPESAYPCGQKLNDLRMADLQTPTLPRVLPHQSYGRLGAAAPLDSAFQPMLVAKEVHGVVDTASRDGTKGYCPIA